VKILRAWLERRSQMQEQAGFDYAAGQLLKGVNPERVLAECADIMFDKSEFEHGMYTAVQKWEEREYAKGPTTDKEEQEEQGEPV